MEADALISDLSNPAEELRKAALMQLARSGEVRAIPAIQRMVSGDSSAELRYLARKVLNLLTASVAAEEPSPSADSQRFDDPEPSARVAALRWAVNERRTECVAQIEARATTEEEPQIRALVVTALGALGGPEILPTLELMLADPDARVRANTLEALEQVGDAGVYPIFVRYIQDPDNRIRANAVRALGRLGRADVLKICMAMIRSGRVWMMDSALYLLAQMKLPESLACFEAFLKHPAADLQAKARMGVQLLADAGNEEARKLLEEAPAVPSQPSLENVEALAEPSPVVEEARGLGDPSIEGRLVAVEDLVKSKAADAIPALMARLEIEESPKVKAALVGAIGLLGDHGVVHVLSAHLRDADDRVRKTAVEAFAKLGRGTDLKSLVPVLEDVQISVRIPAICALWGKGMGDARGVLVGLANSSEVPDRLAAIDAIERIGEAASGLLGALSRDVDASVQARAQACRRALGIPDEEAETPVSSSSPSADAGPAMNATRRIKAPRVTKTVAKLAPPPMSPINQITTAGRRLSLVLRVRAGRSEVHGATLELANEFLKELGDEEPLSPEMEDRIELVDSLRDKTDAASKAQLIEAMIQIGTEIRDQPLLAVGSAGVVLKRLNTASRALKELEEELEGMGDGQALKVAGIVLVAAVLIRVVMIFF